MPKPYENGEMFNIFNNVASEAPTLSPGFKIGTSLMISIVPFEILVGMDKAWKKDVFSGPKPVFWAGMMTSNGAIAPARAGARTLLCVNFSRTSAKSPLVNTKPTLPLMCGKIFSNRPLFSKWPRMALRIMVFLPHNTTAKPRNDVRMVCIWREPTLSQPTMKHFGYSSKS